MIKSQVIFHKHTVELFTSFSMKSMYPLHSSSLHPVILSKGSVLIDGHIFQGLKRRQHNVYDSISWSGSQRRGKRLSHVGFLQVNKQTHTCCRIGKGGKRFVICHAEPPVSAEHSETEKFPSTAHNPPGLNSDMAEQREEHGLMVTDADQQQKAHKQLTTLDSYFDKLHVKTDKSQGDSVTTNQFVSAIKLQPNPKESTSTGPSAENKSPEEDKQMKSAGGLSKLDNYFNKLYEGPHEVQENDIPKLQGSEKVKNDPTTEESEFSRELIKIIDELQKKLESDKQVESQFEETTSELVENEKQVMEELVSPYDEPPNPYLINTFAAINIAVYLFELASPVRSSGMGSSSLPLIYGAKINELILYGEWWRLITPMFLHSGLLHVAFSSWALLTFGPLVDRAYGSFAFCMIYFLGGVSGNLMSFFHTPEATVGGTGPVFAVIGSWIVYLIQNRVALGEEIADRMIQKVVVASVLSVALSCLTPIDDWTHLGAACAGVIFGFLVCPVVPVNVSSKKIFYDPSDNGQEGFLVVNQWPDPGKLFTIFSLFIATLVTLFFVLAPIITEFHLSNMSDNIFD